MSEQKIEQTEEESLPSDEAIEAAAGANDQKGPTSGPPTSKPVFCPC